MICLNGAISFYRERNVRKLVDTIRNETVIDEGNEEIRSKPG